MATTNKRNEDTDNYKILTSYTNTSDNLEISIAESLVQATTINSGTYTSPADSSSWDCVDLSSGYVNTSAIANYPNGTVTEFSVVSTELYSADVSSNSYTTNISSTSCNNNTYAFDYLNTSAPYYDSNYVFTQSLIQDCSDNQLGTFVKAKLSISAAPDPQAVKSIKNTQYAMQSRWNTTKGPYTNGLATVGGDPTAITQDVSFNTTQAFAQAGTSVDGSSYTSKWASLNSTNGSIIFTDLSNIYQPTTNNIIVENRDMSGVTLTTADIGIFRIQQPTIVIDTKISTNNGALQTITTSDLLNMPLFNGNGSTPFMVDASKNLMPIPGTMTSVQFKSLLNTDVYNTVASDWTFSVDISSNNGGYVITDASQVLMDMLNNDNLLDNPYYMSNYVSNNHSITFSNSTVTIVRAGDSSNPLDANLISVDLSVGEKLSSDDAGDNGQIIFETNTIRTRYADLSNNDVSNNIIPYVYYPTDASPNVINTAEMNAQDFNVKWQKVAQQSSVAPSDTYLKQSNNAIMTLFTTTNVDNFYNADEFEFDFDNQTFTNDDIRLWRLNASNNVILNPQSFYTDASYTVYEKGISTSGIITDLTETINYNGYRVYLTAKTKNELGLYSAVTDASGWQLNYTSENDTFLHSSSTNAYSNKTNIPEYNSDIINTINGGTNLNFTYMYKTIETSDRAGGLSDYVDVTYSYNDVSNNFTISQEEITRTYTSADISYNVVDVSYNFTGNIYNKTNWELVYVTAHSVFNASFPANYGPFTNLNLIVNNINQTDAYYTIRSKISGSFAPASALPFITTNDIPNLRKINEEILPALGNTLTISGIFTSNDLKAFSSVAQGENKDSSWVDITNLINTDVYYGLNNNADINGQNGTLVTNIEYSPFSNSTQQSIIVELDDLNYYIPFVYDKNNDNYVLDSFESSNSTIPANTNMSSPSFNTNNNFLTVQNGYSSVTNWNTSNYNLTHERDLTSHTFIVTDQSNNQIFTIKALNSTIFLGNYIVSYIPKDYYRVDRQLITYSGNPPAVTTTTNYTENFQITDYPNGDVVFSSVPGVTINKYSLDTDGSITSQDISLGSSQSFRVKGDLMSINEVGTTTPPTAVDELGTQTYNNRSLEFQYISGAEYSAKFTFPKYRGYNATGSTRYYTIERDATTVTFDVDANASLGLSKLTDVLTTNMYYNETFTVNNLVNTQQQLVANLNLQSKFNYSILPSNSTLIYSVDVTGDTINVSISNPNYLGDASNIIVPTGATPVVDPKTYTDSMTLKDYGQNDMYTFSGLWYDTNSLMAIRPSRVKLQNSVFAAQKLQYQIKVNPQSIDIYKAQTFASSFNWFGNPEIYGQQNPDISPDQDKWLFITNLTAIEFNTTGFNIGTKTINQNPNLVSESRLSYITSVPPYYKFEQISIADCPVIPYTYGSDYNANIVYRYMPYITTSSSVLTRTFNPFAGFVDYVNIDGYITSVNTSQTLVNNITFNLLDSSLPSFNSAFSETDSKRYGIIVPGTKLDVNLFSGLYNSTDPGSHTNPIWSGPITSLPSTASITTNSLIFRGRDAYGGITFSALQFPEDIGYPSGAAGYEDILHTNNQSNWYNIDFTLGNSSWFNNNSPTTYFDANAKGIKPSLYTVVDVNNPVTQINTRRVYKYTSNATIDIDISSGTQTGLQTINMTFNSRSYKDFDISVNNTFPSDQTQIWDYNTMLNNTIIPNSPINWVSDASYTSMSYVSWSFGNSTTAKNMLIELFGVQDTEKKWVFMTLDPFVKYMNQFGLQVGSIAWDGSVVTPLISTRTIELSPSLVTPILNNNTYSIEQYSESTL